MLTSFRSHIKGWIAWVFVIIVSVPFALWGISSYQSVLSSSYVAEVNGHEISPQAFQNAYQNAYRQRQTSMQGKFNPTPVQVKALRQQVLNQLITRTLLQEKAQNYHFVATKEDVYNQIQQMPGFQLNGKFNLQLYQQLLAANNMTPDQFQASVRNNLKSQVLARGLARSAFVTPSAADSLIALARQQRKVAWFSLPLAGFVPKSPPNDEEIAAYYHAHKAEFTTPMSVTISYVRLNPKALEKGVEPAESDLKAWYRTHQSAYGVPPARKAAEILIKPAGPGAKDAAAAKAQAEKLLGEIQAAKDSQKKFAALARKYSADEVSSRNGGSIGYAGAGQLPAAQDKALFGIAEVGEVAGPIRTPNGWYLIQLLGKRGGSVKPFKEVKAKVKSDYLANKAQDRYFKLGDELANIAYENPGSLTPVAQKLGLKIKTVSRVTLDSGTGVAANEEIRKAAFSGPVLKLHQNSQPVKLGDIDAVVLRVSSTQPSELKPLAKVHDQIVTAINKQTAAKSANAAIQQAQSTVRSGKPIADVAKSLNAELHGPATFARNAASASLPPAVAGAAFTAMTPAKGKSTYGTVHLKDGSPVLFALMAVTPGKVKQLKDQQRRVYMLQLAQLHQNQEMKAYLAWLRSKADVKINEKNIPQ